MQKIIILLIIFNVFINSAFTKNKEHFLMLKNTKVNVRVGPGFDYPVKFIYKKKYLPVKVIDNKENFRKVIDHKKNTGWIHISQLKKISSLIILSDRLIFKKPTKSSKPLVNIKSGRLLIVKKCKKSWCKVKSDEYSGWIKSDDVWGK